MPAKMISVHTDKQTVESLTFIAQAHKITRNKLIHNILECFVDMFRADHQSMRNKLDKANKTISQQKDELTALRLQYAKLLIDKRNGQRNDKISS